MKLKELLMTDSSYYTVYKFLPWTNAKEQSKMTLMSMLIDADSFASNRLQNDRDYFQCTNNFIKGVYKANWSRNTLDAYFNELEEEGYIFIKKVSTEGANYPVRCVKLNNQKLTDMYKEFNMCQNLK